jgi:lactate dehydrogenase-like 2-hydroxyacid dehydrogenase
MPVTELFVISKLTSEMRDALDSEFTIHHVVDMDAPEEWLVQNGPRIEYVLTDSFSGIRPEYFPLLPNAKLISSNGVGYDAIDTNEAVRRNILVTHTPSVLDAEVATTVLMLLIACYRQTLPQMQLAHEGRWEVEGNLPLARSADNRTIGILGLGRIGLEITRKLTPFNPRIIYSGRSKKAVAFEYFEDLTDMARAADVLICVVPGGAATHHIVNEDVMNALGPDGVLINVGRGSAVDEAALIAALEDGRLGYAGLDVFENEPYIPEALRALPNVALTAHIGSATVETRAAMAKLAVDNLLEFKKNGAVLTLVPECNEIL